jgi:dipeptidyl aminopeptidase/acylaminoacyl peptidase
MPLLRLSSFVVPLAVLACPQAQERMTPELLQSLARVGDPQPSPDGKRLLYSVRTTQLAEDKGTTHLFLLDLATGERRQVTAAGSNWNGRWSPDGRGIGFLSTRSGTAQAYVLPVDGGEARCVTDVPGGIDNLSWSPTGTHLAFTARVPLDKVAGNELYPDLPKADARIYDSLLVRHWDAWNDGSYSHLFVVPVAGGTPKDLMAGLRYHTPMPPFGGAEQIAWAPDGKSLVYTSKKLDGIAAARSTNSDLWRVDLEGTGAVNLTDGMPGYEIDPTFSKDGRFLAFLSMAREGFESDRNRIFVLDVASGERRELTGGFDQTAHAIAWLPDASGIVFASETRGTTQIYEVGIDGSKPKAISQGRHQFDSPRPGPDGRFVFALRQRTERPPEVVVLDREAPSEGRMLTRENDGVYGKLQLPKVEERWFEATDGKSIHAWVVYPPDFDPARKWPMLLYCQGGPQSQVGQFFSTRWNFHLMAARGYIVLAVNRRGLPGFGQEWNDQISRDWGGQAMQDLLSATDAMQAEGYVDRTKTAAVGASFGGYTIYWLMGNAGDRFAAMISHCGVFDLRSMYATTEELFFVDWDLGGPYWKSPEIERDYERFSPSSFVGTWRTPLLVIHGERDFRVPYAQGLGAFTAAQAQGVPSRFLYFPGEGHWVLRPQNGVLWSRVFFDWLDRYCK